MTARRAQIRRALALSIASVAWSGVVGATAVVAALSSGALSLLGFGATALIDAAASAVLIWRFRTEARNPLRAAQVERRAERAIGVALLALAIYLLVSSARALLSGQHPAAEPVGIALLGASLIVQPLLGVAKRRVGAALGSAALQADGLLSLIGGGLAAVGLVGLAASVVAGVDSGDALAAAVVALVALREGAESLRLSSAATRRRGAARR